MNPSTIRDITEIMQTLSQDTKEAFYWYLIVDYGLPYAMGLLWSIFGMFMGWKIFVLIRKAASKDLDLDESNNE